ncbi:MAG: GNAT family N-acetyltransferase [Bacteroidota bacterium]
MNIKILQHTDIRLLPTVQPDGWSDIIPHFDFYTSSPFCFPIKVTIDDTIVGIGTTIIHHDVAWLAHIIVHKEYRKRGIGQFITEALVEDAKSKNCETIYLLATDLGAPVYEKVGFETETEYLFFKEIKLGKSEKLLVNIELYKEEFSEEVERMDRIISSEVRMFHLKSHLPHGFVYKNNSSIDGFYFPTFGDGLILANTKSAGIALLQLHLQSNERVVFPKNNVAVKNYLNGKGFQEVLTGKRMRLGKKRDVKFENIYNRIGGNLG